MRSFDGVDLLLGRGIRGVKLQNGVKFRQRPVQFSLGGQGGSQIQMRLNKIRTITDDLHELFFRIFSFPFSRQLNSELIMRLPEFRFGFDNSAQAFNRFIPLIPGSGDVGPVEIIRRAFRLQIRRLLVTGQGGIIFSVILLKETQIEIGFHILGLDRIARLNQPMASAGFCWFARISPMAFCASA